MSFKDYFERIFQKHQLVRSGDKFKEIFGLSVLQSTLELRLDFEKMLDDWERVIEVVQQLPPSAFSIRTRRQYRDGIEVDGYEIKSGVDLSRVNLADGDLTGADLTYKHLLSARDVNLVFSAPVVGCFGT